MRIGFDAKRAFYNRSGLGNYSRDTLRSLIKYFPEEEFLLFTPSQKGALRFIEKENAVNIISPENVLGKIGESYWRSFQLGDRLKREKTDIFHGLSNELPFDLDRKAYHTVVTIHDLIFMRFPEWYPLLDRIIYRKKFRYSSKIADCVITVSNQTKQDLIHYFEIDEGKIEVIYQGCNENFKRTLNEEERKQIRSRWNLPKEFILYVGTVEERKNLLSLITAMQHANLKVPLIIVGRQTAYTLKVKKYIAENAMSNIHFLEEVSVEDLPGFYQMANVFVYPSRFEGFGIPILEALNSGVPVITSSGGCFNEVGGIAAQYIDPMNTEELGVMLSNVLNDSNLAESMRKSGIIQAQQFTWENAAKKLMDIYKRLKYE